MIDDRAAAAQFLDEGLRVPHSKTVYEKNDSDAELRVKDSEQGSAADSEEADGRVLANIGKVMTRLSRDVAPFDRGMAESRQRR
mmetsp:Transcript_29184/g.38854  ORF Transcript_29184/g.38854 Transcript_29184/m.38854 type:complete len:84 (+) Transcript_29184:1967-2218(+)|eukprot:CAMPEP_0185569280 /NCGR_PEP_ID=MMETSP0434-20130131/1952_1 /TAXON_ID=626734 ORGANISM="Favella taraikaensis, Strain Fe Narragansett Bay" /NCGR_SAMPLE_ID=MMETSP0434 /ASSEMBLY_ACC=CAM_ASM_000379 /LENGTH=83 /DNA_ID=CAMNT_0028184019 /DNA_START=1469 /DNA_END=1720 /DNA_ORIENTATION=-